MLDGLAHSTAFWTPSTTTRHGRRPAQARPSAQCRTGRHGRCRWRGAHCPCIQYGAVRSYEVRAGTTPATLQLFCLPGDFCITTLIRQQLDFGRVWLATGKLRSRPIHPHPNPLPSRRPLRNLRLAGDRGFQWSALNLRFALTPTLSLQERGFCKGPRQGRGSCAKVSIGACTSNDSLVDATCYEEMKRPSRGEPVGGGE